MAATTGYAIRRRPPDTPFGVEPRPGRPVHLGAGVVVLDRLDRGGGGGAAVGAGRRSDHDVDQDPLGTPDAGHRWTAPARAPWMGWSVMVGSCRVMDSRVTRNRSGRSLPVLGPRTE